MSYELVYDHTGQEGIEEKNIHEKFEGTWTELQEYVKKLKATGCYHIDAAALYEEEEE